MLRFLLPFLCLIAEASAAVIRVTKSDGMNLTSALRDSTLPERPLFWQCPHYGNQGGSPSASIRRGKWKLIEWLGTDRLELYDLAEDIGETKDLSAGQEERIAMLRGELHAWQKEVGALFPTPNPAHDPSKPAEKKK